MLLSFRGLIDFDVCKKFAISNFFFAKKALLSIFKLFNFLFVFHFLAFLLFFSMCINCLWTETIFVLSFKLIFIFFSTSWHFYGNTHWPYVRRFTLVCGSFLNHMCVSVVWGRLIFIAILFKGKGQEK